MFASKSKFFVYYSIVSLLALNFYPLADANAKSINVGITTDTVTIPGQLLNSKLAGSGNRCLYVDATGNVSAKAADCGTMTGGDEMGAHSATQNIRLNTYWLTGDGTNAEGIYINGSGEVGVGTNSIIAGNRLTVSGNLSAAGAVSFTGPIFAGGGNRMITVDNAGVLGAGAIPATTDIYWNGTATNLVAATGRTSLGLGGLAILNSVGSTEITDGVIMNADVSVSAAIAASKIENGTYFINSAGTSGQLWSSDGTGAGAWATVATVPAAGTAGNTLRSNGSAWLANNLLYNNGSIIGINTSAPASANLQINASSTLEALRLVSAAGYSPLNIRNSGNTADIFRVDQTGSLAAGSVPWARLTSYPAACSGGQFVTAVGGTLTCASPAASTDIYWTGTATNLVAATGRTSLGLGGLATLSAVGAGEITDGAIMNADINASAAIADSKIASGAFFITSAGTSGQLWSSDGAGAGAWVNNTSHTGSGTANYATKWTGASSMGNSIIYDNGTYVGIGTAVPGTNKLFVNGNFLASGAVTLSGPIYAGGGNRMVTVDNAGVVGAAAIPVDTNTDVYWTGTATNLVAATGRTSLGLGALATLGAVSGGTGTTITDDTITNADINSAAAISASKIENGTYFINSAGTSGQLWSSDGTGAGTWLTVATVPAAGTNGNTLRSNGSTWIANNLLYNNGNLIGINTTTPASANLQINASSTLEALRIVSAASYSPLNIRNSGNTADIFRVDQTGSLAVGSVPWARLASFPAACSAGQYVTAVGGTLTCATPPDTNTDIYWNGTATNLVAATGRTSLGLGALATLGAVSGGTGTTITDGTITDADISASAAIASSKIANGTYFITSAGTSGQVWTSDGVGAGAWSAAGASHTGSGTANYVTKWTGASSMGNSVIYDNGTNVGIGTVTPGTAKLAVVGDVSVSGLVTANAGFASGEVILKDGYLPNQMGLFSTLSDEEIAVYDTGNSIYKYGNGVIQVTYAGNVGIGTAAPGSYKLNVSGTTMLTDAVTIGKAGSAVLSLTPTGSGSATINLNGNTGGYGIINATGSGGNVLKLQTGAVDRMKIDATGIVSFLGASYIGSGTRLITTDNAGALGAVAGVSGGAGGLITDNTITDADIAASAAISSSKLQYGAYEIDSQGVDGRPWTSDGNGRGYWSDTYLRGSGVTLGYSNNIPSWSSTYGLTTSGMYSSTQVGTVGYVGIQVGMPQAQLDVNGSFRTNSSVTFSLFSGTGPQLLYVDASGVLAATSTAGYALPSGTNNATLRYTSFGHGSWVQSNFMWNTGSLVGINAAQLAPCNASTSLMVGGQIQTPSIQLSPIPSQEGMCVAGGYISYNTGNGSINFSGATAYSFDAAVNSSAGFAYSGTAGLTQNYAANTVLTAPRFGGGLLTSATAVTGLSGTIIVKGSSGTNCNLVFTSGILTSETCP